MIFILHYILFNAGMSAILVLLTLYLQTYSDASLSEIGALLMALPFLSILIKPLFCALADRQRKHKLYLMLALAGETLGYGSLIIGPLYVHFSGQNLSEFLAQYGRLLWYCDILGILIGFSAFGVVWSLGDALAVNAAQVNGVTWGSYRVWAVISWGVFGIIIGQINEMPLMPKYVPAFLILILSLSLEIVLLAFWPNKHFIMGGGGGIINNGDTNNINNNSVEQQQQQQKQDQINTTSNNNDIFADFVDSSHQQHVQYSNSNNNTLTSMSAARSNPRLIGAVANIFMEDLGGSLKSSLRLGAKPKRMGLSQLIEQHHLANSPTTTTTTNSDNNNYNNNNNEDQIELQSTAAAAPTPPPPENSCSLTQQQVPCTPASPAVNSSAQVRRALFAGANGRTTQSIASQADGGSPAGSLRAKSVAPPSGGQPPASARNTTGGGDSVGRSSTSTWRLRTQLALARMDSLSASSGHVIAQQLHHELADHHHPTAAGLTICSNGSGGGGGASPLTAAMYMSSLASNASLGRAAAAHAAALRSSAAIINNSLDSTITSGHHFKQHESPLSTTLRLQDQQQQQQKQLHAQDNDRRAQKRAHDLQLVLLKLIIRRDASIWKYLFLFTLFGFLLTVHLSYFFLHLAKLCKQHGTDFSSVTGGMMAAHSISEVLSFTLIVPQFVPRVGRCGALLTCALVYAVRFVYYGSYYSELSPFTGIPFELCHGVAYGIIYSLITDIACECVDHIDDYLPELIDRGLVAPDCDPNELKLPLRATMQGVFSGAFDGLGNGFGALFGGLFLDAYPFEQLWQLCACVCLLIMTIYPLSEWRQTKPPSDNEKPNVVVK